MAGLVLTVDPEARRGERFGRCLAVFEHRFRVSRTETQRDTLELLARALGHHAQIVRGLGNPALSEAYALALPGALVRMSEQRGLPPGLLQPAPRARGKWATSWLGDLAHPLTAVANGIAYEVLGADVVLRGSVLGFRPCERDHVSFGFKLQASYPGTESQLSGQPRRQTVESDLQLFVPAGPAEIGIDFKHTLTTRPIRLSRQQVSGVVTALTTGEIDRFVFITNGRFSEASHRATLVANKELVDDAASLRDGMSISGPPLALVEGLAPLMESCAL